MLVQSVKPGSGFVCANNREGASCGFCKPNHFSDGSGECAPCEAHDAIPGIIALTLFVVAIGVLGWRMGQKIKKSSRHAISAMIIGTQAGVVVQTLGVFSDLSLVWEDCCDRCLRFMICI